MWWAQVGVMGRRRSAQGPPVPPDAEIDGVWLQGFDHSIDTTGTSPMATDYLEPFRDPNGPNGFRSNFHIVGDPGAFGGWGAEIGFPIPSPGWFNAIHMSLIPKGDHQGKVLVWNRYPVLLRPGSGVDPTDYWAFQAWSIVDPDPAARPRFRNYLLPIHSVGPGLPQITTPQGDLFCSGHVWSQFGDLVVAGGTNFDLPNNVDLGVKYLYLFDPSRPQASLPLPGVTQTGYVGIGRWQNAPSGLELLVDRYYPTVTLAHRLTRLTGSNHTEVIVISGGSHLPSTQNNPGLGDPRNTFETYLVRESTHVAFLERDPLLSGANAVPFEGPGTTPVAADVDWLNEYPRLHLISDGKLFLSGPAKLGAKGNLESPATGVGQWDTTVGRTGLSFQGHRLYGSSLFFGRLGGLRDVTVRLCGQGTDTAEFCLAGQLNAGWQSLGQVPGGPRGRSSAVILPDGSILVAGGDDGQSPAAPVTTTAIFTVAGGWRPVAPAPTARLYHASMVLLPDGRVLFAGGEGRHGVAGGTDYEIYEPPYLHSSHVRPANVVLPGITPVAGAYPLTHGQTAVCACNDDGFGLDFVDRLVLMAPGSTTHHSDMSARYVELVSTSIDATSRSFTVPDELSLPRGYQMLFAVTNAGVPSEAIWVLIQ